MNEKTHTPSPSAGSEAQRADYRAQKEKLRLRAETENWAGVLKKCFKCEQTKPLTEFHTHPQMADGYLNKCKLCTRKDVADRVIEKSKTDAAWLLAERERHRIKAAKNRKPSTLEQRRAVLQRHRKKYPLKNKARQICANAIRGGKLIRQPCEKCGKKAQAYHDDYAKPLEVRWLCPKHHGEHHYQQRNAEIIAAFNSKKPMSTPINDGGPAFPCPATGRAEGDTSMTLRDYFAAKAMQGFISNAPTANADILTLIEMPAICYHIADCMIAARTKQP
jgi:hypothetical protein